MSDTKDLMEGLPHTLWFVTHIAGYEVHVYKVANLTTKTTERGFEIPQDDGIIIIGIDDEITKQPHQLLEVLIHEFIHAVSDEYELNLSERTVMLLGLGLHQALSPFLKLAVDVGNKGEQPPVDLG